MCCRYHRVEVLGALASVLSTWLVTGILVVEAVDRIFNPVDVNGKGGSPYELLQAITRTPQAMYLSWSLFLGVPCKAGIGQPCSCAWLQAKELSVLLQ